MNVVLLPACRSPAGVETVMPVPEREPRKGRVRALSFHAGYRCRHAGACCTSGWPIPVEANRLMAIRAAVASGRLRPARESPDITAGTRDHPAVLAALDRRCVFHDDGHRCRIHGTLGHEALPLACRQFPRVTVQDPGGTSVTLSHFCPTAAALLDAEGVAGILDDTPAFPAGAEYVGLDAREALPPLLRPDMLMDWVAWRAWEGLAVALLTGHSDPPAVALGRVALAVEGVRPWRPGEDSLAARVEAAGQRAATSDVAPFSPDGREVEVRVREVLGAVPHAVATDIPRPDPTARVEPSARAAGRFLAAHAFASWQAHLGHGLRSWLRSVEAAWALLAAGFTVRQADLLLRHLADAHALAAVWDRGAGEATRRP